MHQVLDWCRSEGFEFKALSDLKAAFSA